MGIEDLELKLAAERAHAAKMEEAAQQGSDAAAELTRAFSQIRRIGSRCSHPLSQLRLSDCREELDKLREQVQDCLNRIDGIEV